MLETAGTKHRLRGRAGIRSGRVLSALFVGAVLTAATGFLLHDFRFGTRLRNGSYDLSHIMRGEVRTREAIVIALDDASFEKLRQDPNAAWDRGLHAQLVDRLA